MIKTIRFLGKVILFLARTIELLSTVLKFMVFVLFFMGIFGGVMLGFFDLISPHYSFYGHIAWDIVAVVIGAGLLYLTWEKTIKQEREYNKKLEDLRKWNDEHGY